MLLNEIINEVGMTKRAVKYYEEKVFFFVFIKKNCKKKFCKIQNLKL